MSMTKEPEIVLALNQNANTGECGSCARFDRCGEGSEWDKTGLCHLELPPQYQRVEYDPELQPRNTVQDTASCSFWKSTGKTFIVSQRLKP